MLPADPLLGTEQQKIVARLWKRRQTETGWVFLVGLPSYRDLEDGSVEAAEYRGWVRAPDHGRSTASTTTRSSPRSWSGHRRRWSGRSSGDAGLRGGCLRSCATAAGPARSVLHTPDCEEAPAGAPLLNVDRALDAAEHPGTRLCGAAQELTPLLHGFDHITDSAPDDS